MIEGKGKIAYIKCAGKPTQCDSELDSVVCLCQWLAALSASTVKYAIVGLLHCLYMWYILFITHTEPLVQVNITSKGWTPAGTNRHRASRVSQWRDPKSKADWWYSVCVRSRCPLQEMPIRVTVTSALSSEPDAWEHEAFRLHLQQQVVHPHLHHPFPQ